MKPWTPRQATAWLLYATALGLVAGFCFGFVAGVTIDAQGQDAPAAVEPAPVTVTTTTSTPTQPPCTPYDPDGHGSATRKSCQGRTGDEGGKA